MLRTAPLALPAVALCACAPSALEARFDSPNPAARLYAIQEAMRTRDVSAARDIVEALDSDDPVVRMMAIEALELLTGETHDYRFDDPAWKRRAAIAQWVDAVDTVTASSTGEVHTDDG